MKGKLGKDNIDKLTLKNFVYLDLMSELKQLLKECVISIWPPFHILSFMKPGPEVKLLVRAHLIS